MDTILMLLGNLLPSGSGTGNMCGWSKILFLTR